MAQALARIYDILDAEPRFPSKAARAELATLSKTLLGIYVRLASVAADDNVRAWKMTAKFHLMQHILEDQCWSNPRLAWTYADEDLQRILKEVALSCHPSTTTYMVLFKWACVVFDA